MEPYWPAGLTLLLVIGAIMDIKDRRLPNWLALVLLVYGLVFAFIDAGLANFGSHAAHAVISLLVGMGLFAIGAFGGGDAKFYAGTAAFFPLGMGIKLFVSVAIIGGILVIIWMIGRRLPGIAKPKEERTKGQFPYGVAIASGAIALVWSTYLTQPPLPGLQ